jgi:hypothetical protein
MFLRNVDWHSTDYTALYPRRWYSSKLSLSLGDRELPTKYLTHNYIDTYPCITSLFT